jgi:hypothetical protein
MNSTNYHHAMSRVAGSYGYIAPGKHPWFLELQYICSCFF